MKLNFINIYNNLIKLTRNKNLYYSNKQDVFYDRMIILFFHFSFLLKEFKEIEDKKKLQEFFDFFIRQIELSIREIGYGDASINKKMKDYVNLLFSIIDNIHYWNDKTKIDRIKIFKLYINDFKNYEYFEEYFDKYRVFLTKNTLNNLSKDIINL